MYEKSCNDDQHDWVVTDYRRESPSLRVSYCMHYHYSQLEYIRLIVTSSVYIELKKQPATVINNNRRHTCVLCLVSLPPLPGDRHESSVQPQRL